MATRRPPACSFLIRSILSFGVACARKSSTPASRAMNAAVSGLSPVIITVRIPIMRSRSNRSRMPPFTMSLSEKIVDARLARDERGGERIVAGDHHRADSHHAQPVEPLAHAALHDVLEI